MSDTHRRPVPPHPKPTTTPSPLNRLWSHLPASRLQEILMVLSQVIAHSLPAAARKEASQEHP